VHYRGFNLHFPIRGSNSSSADNLLNDTGKKKAGEKEEGIKVLRKKGRRSSAKAVAPRAVHCSWEEKIRRFGTKSSGRKEMVRGDGGCGTRQEYRMSATVPKIPARPVSQEEGQGEKGELIGRGGKKRRQDTIAHGQRSVLG